ncbi:MAG: DNA translocase FtsK [Candidatus Omnitrophica bacterium]|nr:DNA translocase FtsK [Candidatus Omnitrophota bacterium]
MNRPRWQARIGSIGLIASGLFLLVSFLTYQPADVPWLSSSPNSPPANLGGVVGVWLGFFGRTGFGWACLFLCLLCFLWALRLWRNDLAEVHGFSQTLAISSLLASIATLLALFALSPNAKTQLGGAVGFILARSGRYYLGDVGTVLVALCVGLLSWLVISGQTLRQTTFGRVRRLWAGALRLLRIPLPATARMAPRSSRIREEESSDSLEEADSSTSSKPALTPSPEPRVRIRSTVEPKRVSLPTPALRKAPGGFQLPSLDLLTNPPPLPQRQISEDLQMNARILEETLREFGIEATVVNIDRGPTVTRYELTPAPGVKLNKIVSLADDLALVMKAASCHVVAPIPGKGRVGVDVPNTITTVVYLKEIITSHEFASNHSPIVLPIGKDVSGQAIITDLRECPHLLIAGATGSGKTVCLNSLLTGILTHSSPEQVRFLMVDPKMVELAMFNHIPHLIAPVVTHTKKAAAALQWAVEEMERRYQLLASVGVRNIDMFNKQRSHNNGAAAASPPKEESASDGPVDDGKPLPYLVVVIDELADLMMVSSQDVEGAITRLAQLSRAVGIHIILATQRPSVDVITGVIKANFPARIAFQVASKVDSRTILDANGADKLLGRGDLLFLRPGTAKPIRAQGALVTDAEIERVTTFLKQQQSPVYDERFMERSRQPEGISGLIEKDELYEMAKQLVLDTGQASTSFLQRRLRLGYGRAARILDLMEQEGLVGPPQGSRPREILISREATKGQM